MKVLTMLVFVGVALTMFFSLHNHDVQLASLVTDLSASVASQ